MGVRPFLKWVGGKRQLLPVLSALHSQQLLHGDLAPANLLRRERDGLPVLLDFGLVRGTALPHDGQGPIGTTPGYGPPELSRGEPAEPWMDLYSLGVVSLVLDALKSSTMAAEQLESLELLQEALGGWHLEGPSLELYTAYEPAYPADSDGVLARQITTAVRPLLTGGGS